MDPQAQRRGRAGDDGRPLRVPEPQHPVGHAEEAAGEEGRSALGARDPRLAVCQDGDAEGNGLARRRDGLGRGRECRPRGHDLGQVQLAVGLPPLEVLGRRPARGAAAAVQAAGAVPPDAHVLVHEHAGDGAGADGERGLAARQEFLEVGEGGEVCPEARPLEGRELLHPVPLEGLAPVARREGEELVRPAATAAAKQGPRLACELLGAPRRPLELAGLCPRGRARHRQQPASGEAARAAPGTLHGRQDVRAGRAVPPRGDPGAGCTLGRLLGLAPRGPQECARRRLRGLELGLEAVGHVDEGRPPIEADQPLDLMLGAVPHQAVD